MRILHHGAISLFHVILEILHIPSPSNIVIIFLWSPRLWCEFVIYCRCSEVSFTRLPSDGVIKFNDAGTGDRTHLKTAFHAREHNCWRKFHLTAFKIPQQTNNCKKRIQRHWTSQKARDLVPYGVIWKVIIVLTNLARKPVSARKQRHLCSETVIGVLQRTQSKISLS